LLIRAGDISVHRRRVRRGEQRSCIDTRGQWRRAVYPIVFHVAKETISHV